MSSTLGKQDAVVSQQDLWERLPVALYRATRDGRLFDVNDAFVHCFVGPGRESLLGVRIDDLLVDPNDAARWRARLARDDDRPNIETRMRRLDGTTFWARETGGPQRSGHGDATFYEGWIEDVTQARHRDRLLETSELRYRRLFEAAKDGILILDAETAEIVDVNVFLCDLLGLSREEILGRKLWEIGPFKDALASKDNFRELQRSEYIRYENLPLQSATGVTIAVEFVSNVYLVGSEKVIQCNIRDITERTLAVEARGALEQQLFQAQKMEAVGRLAGGVAHDFNNLIGVISGFGELVHRQMAGDDPLKPKIAQILKAADRAAGLTRQLLAFGRQQVLQPKVLNLNVVVSEMDSMLRCGIGEDVELTTLFERPLGNVRVDPVQIEQVLMNLAVNARDAMPDGGRITIETRNAELAAEQAGAVAPTPPGRYVLLMVSDTGSGMDAETQAKIFEPFFSTKDVAKGTGLGLSTVYGIVRQSDGHVRVGSALGVGTTFEIYFPRVDEEASPPPAKSPAPLVRGAETVLLAEDEALLRDVLVEVLAAHGYSVLVAGDGLEALQIANTHAGPIHIMVSDVIMPGLTGPRVAELVAGGRPEMKVLYISGYTAEAATRHDLTGPGKTFLGKPFTLDVLLRTVRESLDQA